MLIKLKWRKWKYEKRGWNSQTSMENVNWRLWSFQNIEYCMHLFLFCSQSWKQESQEIEHYLIEMIPLTNQLECSALLQYFLFLMTLLPNQKHNCLHFLVCIEIILFATASLFLCEHWKKQDVLLKIIKYTSTAVLSVFLNTYYCSTLPHL